MKRALNVQRKSKPGHTKWAKTEISLLLCLLIASLFVLLRQSAAQGITGTITGMVTDNSGAAVAGATVTIREVNTNAVRTLTTSNAGTYKATLLQVGTYSVKVSQAGYKTVEQNNLLLQIDQTAVIDLLLPIGQQVESVEVTSAPPALQTEESSIGQVVDSVALQNTPLNGRLSVMGLVALAPGIQGVGAQDQLATRGMTVAAGTGSRNSYGSLGSTLDGVTNTEVSLQRAEPEIPSIDAISQFKVLSTGAPAEFNQPVQVIVLSASGTNAFHGELLEYNRSKGTSAKSYFNGSSARPAYERNEFGGNFAGPVLIPHVYNGRDRTFFFVAYEGFRLNQSSSVNSTQPTAAMRNGDFSAFLDANGNCPTGSSYFCVINPATGLAYANNKITNLNSVSVALMNKLMPSPTTTGTGVNTYELIPYTSTSTRVSLHMDHKLGPNDQLRGTLLRALYGPNPTVGSSSLQGGKSADGEKNTNIILGWTHTFSPTMVLDTNASYFHLPIFRTPQNNSTDWESIIPGLATQYIEGAPHLNITNITSTGESGSHDLEQVSQINTSLTKVFARHTLKAGFGYLYDNHWNVSAQTDGYEHGSFNFNGQFSKGTQSTVSNNEWAFADYLLGLPSTVAQGNPGSFIARHISSQWNGYVQDDWKPRPNLTINIGLRYDLQWFQQSPYNNASLYVPSVGKVVVFGSSYPSSIVASSQSLLNQYGLLTLSSSAGISNNPFSYVGRPAKNFAPRLGFAYQLGNNTVLRGAYGIYFSLLPDYYVGGVYGSAPFLDYSTYTNSTTYSSAFTMSKPFVGAASGSGSPSVNAMHTLATPYTEGYNLAVEHQFPYGIAARVGYVGQHNLKQNNYGGNGNYAPDLNLPAQPVLTETTQASRLVQPLSTVPNTMAPIFHTIMNSLQIGLHKQFAQGLAFGVEYQWVRVLGTENILNPSGSSPRDSYGPVSGITPQVLQLNYSYELPVGHNKLLFHSAGATVDKLISGWKLSGTVNAQTGQPFSVTFNAAGSTAYPGLVSGRANRVAGAALYPSHKTKAQWFNTAAFTCPSITDGSGNVLCGANYGNSGYNMLRGPGFQDWDMSLQKNTRWHDRYNVQLRADAFNLFNHPNFSTPNSNISSSSVGKITSTASTPTYQARTMEFAVKFSF